MFIFMIKYYYMVIEKQINYYSDYVLKEMKS